MERKDGFNQEPTNEQNNSSQEMENKRQTNHNQYVDNGANNSNQDETEVNYENEETGLGLTKPPKPQKQKSTTKNRSGVHSLFGGIIGGVISAVIVAFLFTSNIIPIDTTANDSKDDIQAANNQSESHEVSNMISSDDVEVSSNINEVSEAVVGVINLQEQNIWTQGEEAGSGSGIIYKKENGKAYVVTNNHVVDGAENVEVVLNDDERIEAKILGTDALTDLAILEIDGSKVNTVAKLGSSNDIQVGDTVIAIGNPLGMEFSGSVTKGIVSGLKRSIEVDTNGDRQPDWVAEVLQTDAAINPGNSGGALVNTDGEVIGINSMKIARREVEGIGFAIPVDAAMPIMEQLESNGKVARPYIGISTVALNQVPSPYRNQIELPEKIKDGMVIAQAEAGSPADKAGLEQFDVITKINDQEIASLLDLRKYMYSETSIGDTINLEVYRDGKPKTVELTLIKRDLS